MIENPNHRLDHGANLKRNRNYAVSPLSQHNIKKADQLLAYQFFSPGAPYIYYGDEVGMWGADDPDCRKPMIWDDIQYEDEHALPYGNPRKKGYQVSQDKSRLNFFKRLCAIRKSNTALREGDFNVILQNNRTRMLGFRRTHKQNECLVFFNSSDTPQEIPKVADSMKLELFSSGTTRKIISSKGFVLFVK
jgi:glycosidase